MWEKLVREIRINFIQDFVYFQGVEERIYKVI